MLAPCSLCPAVLRLFGYRKGELEGCNVMRIMPNPFSAQHDGERGAAGGTGKCGACGGFRACSAGHVLWEWMKCAVRGLLRQRAATLSPGACLPHQLPPPHLTAPGYLRNYATSRVPRILDTKREVVALHKQRFVFGVQLCVTPVALGGERAVGLGRGAWV